MINQNLKKKYLIIGGDSRVGRYLSNTFVKKRIKFFKTSKKKNCKNKNTLFLDLNKPDKFLIPKDVDYCFFLAGITDYTKCEKLKSAKKINVSNSYHLIKRLIALGVHVNFISSNTVFGGMTKKTSEYDKKNPKFNYAKYKSLCEDKILKLTKKYKYKSLITITRLSKILEKNTNPLPFWRSCIKKNKIIFSFYDYFFSPISVNFVIKSLMKISKYRLSGIFHLSNKENINYYEFSKLYFKKKHHLIKKKSIKDVRNFKFYYKPKYPKMLMTETTKKLGIKPEKIINIIKKI